MLKETKVKSVGLTKTELSKVAGGDDWPCNCNLCGTKVHNDLMHAAST